MHSLRTQLYTPACYPDIPVLDEEFDLASQEGAELSDFSIAGTAEFEPAARFD